MAEDSLIAKFKFDSLLSTNDAGRRIVLQGTIEDKPALLLAERSAFSTDAGHLEIFTQQLAQVQTLGQNDIYNWYLANTRTDDTVSSSSTLPHDLKINLIYPCTDKHIRKYSFQQTRVVTETPEIYARYIRPYMQLCREEGRLNWVFNILEGRKEQENVLHRSTNPDSPQDDYLLLPDLNWDRKTTSSLHLLALPARRDIWSARDLRKRDVPWLRALRATLARVTKELYPGVEADMLKFYVHYQPTYYHFHVHVVHVDLDPTGTQAVGKAVGLDHLISQLETMGGGEEAGLHEVELTYTVGEASELWTRIFEPLKEGREPDVQGL